jgi:hypothetical protein
MTAADRAAGMPNTLAREHPELSARVVGVCDQAA